MTGSDLFNSSSLEVIDDGFDFSLNISSQVKAPKNHINVVVQEIFGYIDDFDDTGVSTACYNDETFIGLKDKRLLLDPAFNDACRGSTTADLFKIGDLNDFSTFLSYGVFEPWGEKGRKPDCGI